MLYSINTGAAFDAYEDFKRKFKDDGDLQFSHSKRK